MMRLGSLTIGNQNLLDMNFRGHNSLAVKDKKSQKFPKPLLHQLTSLLFCMPRCFHSRGSQYVSKALSTLKLTERIPCASPCSVSSSQNKNTNEGAPNDDPMFPFPNLTISSSENTRPFTIESSRSLAPRARNTITFL